MTANNNYKFGFNDPEESIYKAKKGLSEDIIKDISREKGEATWITQFRLDSYKIFLDKPLPTWGVDLSSLDFDKIFYYLKPTDKVSRTWADVPENIRKTYDKLGIPQAEKDLLAGVKAQYDSEVVYGSLIEILEKQGVVFMGMDEALKTHEGLIREHFGKLIPSTDNKFSALNSCVFSGGSFVYVPKNVKVSLPLQAYFRINAQNMGQFERTLIIADEGSEVHYVEGCTAPVYSTDSLHSAVVEVFVKKNARVRYTTIQNWSNNVYNLVTKRALTEENGVMEWVDCNLGSKITMKYPAVILKGDNSHGEVLSLAYAGEGQQLDAGAKMVHLGKNTTSKVTSKSISMGGGKNSYRGLVRIAKGAENSTSKVVCDALLLDDRSRTDTYPTIKTHNATSIVEHEASVSRLSQESLFYLQSRGLNEEQASSLLVNGFVEPIVKMLPMEYAVEMNRLIEMEMEGAVG